MIRDCPHSIQSYWYFRDEITYEEGILYKGVRLIMPQSEQASTLKVLHMGQYAVNKMNLRARKTVYWPGISEDIKATYLYVTSVQGLQEFNRRRPCSMWKHPKPDGNNLF